VLLVEYGKAQDSAEHHDNLVWSIASLNWVGSAVLLGFVFGTIDADECIKTLFVLNDPADGRNAPQPPESSQTGPFGQRK
jgi:hypothetical protein